MLGVVDDLHTLFLAQYFKDIKILTNILRRDIFLEVKEQKQDD